jgi:hypothetical protein
MTRLSVERLEEIRARVVRWASVPFAMSGTLADYVKKANEAHTWPGAERDEEHVAEAESWAEMIGDDPVVGVLVDALRLANRDRADLLAELDAVREDARVLDVSWRAALEEMGRASASAVAYLDRATAAEARLLVMTRERDALRDERPGMRRVVELARMYERALDREGSADEDTDDLRGKLFDALYALGEAVDAPLETETSLRAELAMLVQQDKGRLESIEALMDRAEAAEAEREELAVALEHLREAASDVRKYRDYSGPPLGAWGVLERALALPTSEAADAQRIHWEGVGYDAAKTEIDRARAETAELIAALGFVDKGPDGRGSGPIYVRNGAQVYAGGYEGWVSSLGGLTAHKTLAEALAHVVLGDDTTARRGWEAKGLELAAKVASDDAEKRRTAGDGFDGYTSSSSIDKATALYALASTLRDMAQKRQGGG